MILSCIISIPLKYCFSSSTQRILPEHLHRTLRNISDHCAIGSSCSHELRRLYVLHSLDLSKAQAEQNLSCTLFPLLRPQMRVEAILKWSRLHCMIRHQLLNYLSSVVVVLDIFSKVGIF